MKELLSKEPKLKHLQNSQHIHIAKTEEVCFGEDTKFIVGQPLHKEIPMMVISHLSGIWERTLDYTSRDTAGVN